MLRISESRMKLALILPSSSSITASAVTTRSIATHAPRDSVPIAVKAAAMAVTARALTRSRGVVISHVC